MTLYRNFPSCYCDTTSTWLTSAFIVAQEQLHEWNFLSKLLYICEQLGSCKKSTILTACLSLTSADEYFIYWWPLGDSFKLSHDPQLSCDWNFEKQWFKMLVKYAWPFKTLWIKLQNKATNDFVWGINKQLCWFRPHTHTLKTALCAHCVVSF